jgi:hypothetical protein
MLGLWSRSKETDQASAAREARTAKSLDTLGKSQTDMQLPDTSAFTGTYLVGLPTTGLLARVTELAAKCQARTSDSITFET